MQETVPATFTARPGYRLVPVQVGKPGHRVTVWAECPDWCVGHDVPFGSAEDINHQGESAGLNITEDQAVTAPVEVYLSWWPGSDDVAANPCLAVDFDSEVAVYSRTAGLALSDQIIAFGMHVRQLAATLPDGFPATIARSQADEALRQVRPWLELTLGDVDTMPVSRLLKVFGVTVIEDGAVPDGKTAALTGKPGSMTLSYQQDVTQAEREQAVRALLADHVAVSR